MSLKTGLQQQKLLAGHYAHRICPCIETVQERIVVSNDLSKVRDSESDVSAHLLPAPRHNQG